MAGGLKPVISFTSRAHLDEVNEIFTSEDAVFRQAGSQPGLAWDPGAWFSGPRFPKHLNDSLEVLRTSSSIDKIRLAVT